MSCPKCRSEKYIPIENSEDKMCLECFVFYNTKRCWNMKHDYSKPPLNCGRDYIVMS